jgi:hypothetical protein
MAHGERGRGDTQSAPPEPLPSRRWRLVGAAVLIPIALGALATVVLYASHPHPAAVRTSTVPDTEVVHGSVFIMQPHTSDLVKIPLGGVLEIVLPFGLGQDVVSQDPTVLVATPNPPCYAARLCGLATAHIWSFQATHTGLARLKITLGVDVCGPVLCTVTPVVLKPISVSS